MTLPIPQSIATHADRVVRIASQWAGRYWPDAELAAFLFPGEAVSTELQELHDDWSCEVFAWRVWLAALVEAGVELPPEATLPYAPHSGAIAVWLPHLARRLGMNCLDMSPTTPPDRGDVVLMQHPSSPHASVIVDDGAIDGGQLRPGGNEKGVRARRRLYLVESGRLVARDVDDTHSPEQPGPAAPVLWVMRAAGV